MDGLSRVAQVSMSDKPDSRFIELSSVYFYEGTLPSSIALKDCSLSTERNVPDTFLALYGYQSKQDGFMAARAYANENRLRFTVIDFLVKLDEKQNPLTMKPDELASHDFISFQRLSKSMAEEIGAIIRPHAEQLGLTDKASKPQQLLMQYPELISPLLQSPGWEHLKVAAYPSKVQMSPKPLAVGAIPFRHWGSIAEATCRLNPEVFIRLDHPSPAAAPSRDSPVDRPVTSKPRNN